MSIERTFSIIKPDATARNLDEEINARIRAAGLKIVATKRVEKPTREQIGKFYEEHQGKPFYDDLVDFMTSGPIRVQVLEGNNAISRYRELMGKTDPNEAAEGTLRKLYAESKGRNSVHGSDSSVSANREISLWFTREELI
jgi:nucleoside-diphosphate kinase